MAESRQEIVDTPQLTAEEEQLVTDFTIGLSRALGNNAESLSGIDFTLGRKKLDDAGIANKRAAIDFMKSFFEAQYISTYKVSDPARIAKFKHNLTTHLTTTGREQLNALRDSILEGDQNRTNIILSDILNRVRERTSKEFKGLSARSKTPVEVIVIRRGTGAATQQVIEVDYAPNQTARNGRKAAFVEEAVRERGF